MQWRPSADQDWEQPGSEEENDLSYSLISLEGVIKGMKKGTIIRVIKGNTRSLDYSPSGHFALDQEARSSSADGSVLGGSRKHAAAHRLMVKALLENPKLIYEALEAHLLEDFANAAVSSWSPGREANLTSLAVCKEPCWK